MSSTTQNRNFRKVDVDKYDEDAYQEDTATQSASFNESAVNSSLSACNYSSAIKLICSSSVISSDDQKQKMSLVDAFIRLNSGIKSSNIDELVKSLSEEDKNNLIKVIYMAFWARPEADHSLTHVWFDKVFAHVGLGAIVRVMTDRKAVNFK
uniref:Actin-related protein 2/3 complex subunit 5 n=1 Tax=Henneguya salminicola TaxID=69463 RepID=A0A6G3ML78_HENSL